MDYLVIINKRDKFAYSINIVDTALPHYNTIFGGHSKNSFK